jgi:hypothetical protein
MIKRITPASDGRFSVEFAYNGGGLVIGMSQEDIDAIVKFAKTQKKTKKKS